MSATTTKVYVHIDGCDDSTVLEVDATDDQVAFLRHLEGLSGELGGGCCPTLRVVEAAQPGSQG